jgi:hypothetical protein
VIIKSSKIYKVFMVGKKNYHTEWRSAPATEDRRSHQGYNLGDHLWHIRIAEWCSGLVGPRLSGSTPLTSQCLIRNVTGACTVLHYAPCGISDALGTRAQHFSSFNFHVIFLVFSHQRKKAIKKIFQGQFAVFLQFGFWDLARNGEMFNTYQACETRVSIISIFC